MKPVVSVIIPCYNAAPWLAATLDSVLAQRDTVLDVIVVDDGSTDASRTVAAPYAARGVRVIEQPNRGASAARNHGFRLARGSFIQFLDADDLLAPDKIARQLALLATTPSGAIAAGPWGRFESDPASARFVPEDNWRDLPAIDWLALNFAGRGMMPPAAWLAPRSLIEAAGPWDERLTLNDDGEYFCRVLLASAGVRFEPAARSYYRSNLAGSLSARTSRAAWESAVLSHELCRDHLLAREDTPRTHRACADLFQRLAYALYPAQPDLSRRCEAEARRHGGSTLQAEGGRAFRYARAILGWRAARRLATLL